MLKKLLLKTVMYGFVMFGLSIYAGYLMTGHVPAYLSAFKDRLPSSNPSAAQPSWSNIGKLEHKADAQDGNYEVVRGGKTVIYKWQDASGHWQYGERAPRAGAATKIEIAPPPSTQARAEPTKPTPPATVQPMPEAAPAELANPYSPEGVKQIMDKAHAVQRMMNERNERLGQE